MRIRTMKVAAACTVACLCWTTVNAVFADGSAASRNAPVSPASKKLDSNSQMNPGRPFADPKAHHNLEMQKVDRAQNVIDRSQLRLYPVYPVFGEPASQNSGQRGGPPPSECVFTPCENPIYLNENRDGLTGIGDPVDQARVCDDIVMVGTDRFLCAMILGLGGVSGDGSEEADFTISMRSGNLTPDCPDSANSFELFTVTRSVALINPPQPIRIEFDPPLYIDEDFLWICVSSASSDASWALAGPAETGSTQDLFHIEGDAGCDGPEFFFFGGDPVAGFEIDLRANPGPTGACCVADTATCTEGVTRNDCVGNSLTATWSPDDCGSLTCTQCLTVAQCDSATAEGEPNCGDGYQDTFNNGCLANPLGTNPFTTIACGQSICGKTGNFRSFCTTAADCDPGVTCAGFCQGETDNRDNDWYRFTLTQDSNVTITFTPRFDGSIGFFNTGGDGNNCQTAVISAGDLLLGDACQTLTINRCLEAGSWFFRIRPNFFIGTPCNLDPKYLVSLSCTTCSPALVKGACCDDSVTGCSLRAEFTCVGRGGEYKGDNTTCAVEGATCPGIPTNDECGAAIALAAPADQKLFNSSFANDSSIDGNGNPDAPAACPVGSNGPNSAPIRDDVFYTYTIPTRFAGNNVTAGDVIISTIGSNFDTWIVVYADAGATSGAEPCTCVNPAQLTCNDDILDDPDNPFKFNSVSHLDIPVAFNSNTFMDPGDCLLIRVGGPGRGGAGVMNIDFIPTAPSPPFGSDETGRCCFFDDITEVVTCNIQLTEADCITAGGYGRYFADFNEGAPVISTPPQSEDRAGCNSDPCPARGDACYTAYTVDFNGATPSGGSGTFTRAIDDIFYMAYELPSSGGVVIDTCGSAGFFDPGIEVYSNNLEADGDCDAGAPIASNDDCVVIQSSADGALIAAACYGQLNSTSDSCLCLAVGSTPELAPGNVIYIAFGTWNEGQFAFPDSNRKIIDPVPDDLGGTVAMVIKVTQTASCFNCDGSCPGGPTTPEGEVVCSDSSEAGTVDNPGPQDTYNGGCFAAPFSFNGPVLNCSISPITVCGKAGNFRHPNPCDAPADCPAGGQCTGLGGQCTGTGVTDFINRDTDWYKVVVNGPGVIKMRVTKSSFPVEAGLVADLLGDCNGFFVAFDDVTFPCDPENAGTPNILEITASVCGGIPFYAYIAPSVFGGIGETACDSGYVFEISCEPFVQETACCPGDMNNDGSVNGKDIKKWIDTLFFPPTLFDEFQGCFGANMCRADINNSGVIDLTDLPLFVNLLVTTTKPVCSTEVDCFDPAFGQPPGPLETNDIGCVKSDLDPASDGTSGDYRAADCFCPTQNGSITQVCWWGTYIDNASVECGPEKDCFQISFYNQSDADRCPDARIEPPGAQFVGLNVSRTAIGSLNPSGTSATGLVTEYFYTATLPTPVAVTAGQCMWIEIVNNTPVGDNNCFWNWETSPLGDNRHAEIDITGAGIGQLPTSYASCTATNVKVLDMAFSVGVRIDKEGCGKPLGRCCFDAAPLGVIDCEMTTEEVCVTVRAGEWSEGGACPPSPACTVGRCCYLTGITTNCVQTLKSTCDSLDGIWAASPAACPCPTGKCCIGAACSVGVTEVKCIADGGRWLATGTCATACPTDICGNNGACQTANIVSNILQGGYVSDIHNDSIVADDFRASANTTVAQLCWRGYHSPIGCDGGEATPETFDITFYLNSGSPGLPGAVHAGPISVTPLKTDTGADSITLGSPVYTYEVVLATPVAVTSGTCYWVEIKNTTLGGEGCVWVWGTSNEGANKRAAINVPGVGGYQNLDRDLAFCVGGPTATTIIASASCTGSFTAPANNACASAIALTAGVPVTGTTLGATFDGSSRPGCGLTANVADVWYKFTTGATDITMTLNMCSLSTTYDSLFSIHTGCPGLLTNQIGSGGAGCNNNGSVCTTGLGTGQLFHIGAQSSYTAPNTILDPNTTYFIRVTGVSSNSHPGGSKGVFTITATQP